MKPPPYCSSLQDGGGFLCLRFFGWCGSAWGSVLGADALAWFGARLLGSAVFEALPDNAGGVWLQQLRLHRTTQAGECPLCGAERLEDGAPAPRARYAPRGWFLLNVPGMRLWAYLRYTLVCTYMNVTLPKWTNSEPGCVIRGYMLG